MLYCLRCFWCLFLLQIGIEWPEPNGEYKGSASAEGYTLEDGTALNLSDKDQKWLGLKDTFKF